MVLETIGKQQRLLFSNDVFGEEGKLLKIIRLETHGWPESYRLPRFFVVWGRLMRMNEKVSKLTLDIYRKSPSVRIYARQKRLAIRLPPILPVSSAQNVVRERSR